LPERTCGCRLYPSTCGRVRITTSQVAATYLLPPVLAALQQAEPCIQVDLVASNQLSNLLRRAWPTRSRASWHVRHRRRRQRAAQPAASRSR
jgi:LysR substrate binding domain